MPHVREGADVLCGVALEDDQVSLKPRRNTPEVVGLAEKVGGRGRQRGEDLAEGHPSVRHQCVYLRKHLGKDKIIVVGHSFGSIIGLRMVRARPDLFYAYVGTGQVADNTRNYSVAYQALLKKAQAIGNQQAFDELRKIGPPPYTSGEGFRVQRKWANSFEGADQFLFGTLGLTLVAPGYSVQDINDSVDGQMLSGERLVPQTTSLEPKDLGLDFAIPMFFFHGAEDFTTPTALARQYLASIKAPRKNFVPIDGGHFALFMNSNEFLRELVRRVGPLAARR